ncbi:prevent-host-death protein [Bacteroidia bacterium]|nr:prevent-host-death protein [Bacteroidia bacterium]
MAQPGGNIRGLVTDAASGQTLSYVTVVVLNTNPIVGTTTDEQGAFHLPPLPVGRYNIQASFVGYEPATIREVMVSSAKETVLEISMKERILALNEVVVRPKTNKEVPLNTMALAGGRMLSVEEASRYAGGYDDPARLVSAFAGVDGSVSSNGISIRGNSPQFLQWRLEGVEVPNPTHFQDITGVGGGILTALSSQVLGNSDFFTGAFPAEYGNALSGVFDMQLRSGNNQNYEHTAQIGITGIEFASEGPFRKGGQASYLFNYRYSAMGLLNSLAPDMLGGAGGMNYQDLSFKMNFPTRKAGTFSVWSIALTNHYPVHEPQDSALWDVPDYRADGASRQIMAAGGFGHKIFIGNNAYIKTSLTASYTKSSMNQEISHVYNNTGKETPVPILDMKSENLNLMLNTYFNRKFSARHTNRTGFSVTGMFYNLDYSISPDLLLEKPTPMERYAQSDGRTAQLTAYSASSLRLNEQFTANMGVHALYFRINNRWSVEPRLALKWQPLARHSFGLAYGLHSRHEKPDYYFVTTPATGDKLVNQNLDLAKAHHIVLSYDWSVSENVHLKIEPYYQVLNHIPVVRDSLWSVINYRDFWMTMPLTSDGAGRNYGIDFTLERYLDNDFYYMLAASLFESRYRGGDGVWRNTRLNRNFLVNALAGKEWKTGKQKQNILGVNIRCTYQGGDRYIPVDMPASKAQGTLVYDNSRAYEMQLEPAFISHLTVSYKINRKKLAHEFALKMINLTGYREFYGYRFNYRTGEPEMMRESVSIPNIYYKVTF